jgi:hypothetical protein
MRVIDHEPHSWFLFQEGENLFLDANCSHSFFGYGWMIQLNEEEQQCFKAEGRTYLNKLAQSIQDSAPILTVSTSKYKDRDVSRDYREQTSSAVKLWREG